MVVFILINSLNGYPDHTVPCKKVLKPLCTKAFFIHCSQARSVWQTAPPPKTIRQGRELVRNFRLFSRNFPLPTCTNSTFCLFALIWRDSSGAQVTFLRPGATWKETFPGTPLCWASQDLGAFQCSRLAVFWGSGSWSSRAPSEESLG